MTGKGGSVLVYQFEDIRRFLVRRPFLAGDARLVTLDEYESLKRRAAQLDEQRAAYLRAFADGWKAAKE